MQSIQRPSTVGQPECRGSIHGTGNRRVFVSSPKCLSRRTPVLTLPDVQWPGREANYQLIQCRHLKWAELNLHSPTYLIYIKPSCRSWNIPTSFVVALPPKTSFKVEVGTVFLLSTETSFAHILCVLLLPGWLSKIQNALPHNMVRVINHHELFMN